MSVNDLVETSRRRTTNGLVGTSRSPVRSNVEPRGQTGPEHSCCVDLSHRQRVPPVRQMPEKAQSSQEGQAQGDVSQQHL